MINRDILSMFFDSVSSVVFPEVCYFCGAGNHVKGSVICPECRDSVRLVSQPFCNLCGLPLATFDDRSSLLCGRCLTKTPPYDKARYGVYYEQSVRAGVTRLKFHSSLFNVRPVAELLIDAFTTHYSNETFDAIVPVPVHKKRLINRGFNQVITISERLSRETGIVLDRTSLVKTRDTEPQVGLSRARRLVNLKNAFQVCRPPRIVNKRILIVDDVSTTGATVSEAAKVVRKAGASYIAVMVLALRSK
ncbi:MAG: ComF family protein [Syntrophaceae bacterium]|nr:ComF family protein [Syntrophaceae bacterium]